MKNYRQWLRDQATYRRKASKSLIDIAVRTRSRSEADHSLSFFLLFLHLLFSPASRYAHIVVLDSFRSSRPIIRARAQSLLYCLACMQANMIIIHF